METQSKKPRNVKLAILIVTLLVAASLTAGFAGYYIGHPAATNNQQNQETTSSNQVTSSDSSASVTSNQTDAS